MRLAIRLTYHEYIAAVVGLLQLGRRAGDLSGASFGPIGVAHGEDVEGQAGLRRRLFYLGLMAVSMRAGGAGGGWEQAQQAATCF
jgi:hypothetical protein